MNQIQLQQQAQMALSLDSLYPPCWVFPDDFDLSPGSVNSLEERVSVPHKDWKEWQKFKQAPWWRRLFWRFTSGD